MSPGVPGRRSRWRRSRTLLEPVRQIGVSRGIRGYVDGAQLSPSPVVPCAHATTGQPPAGAVPAGTKHGGGTDRILCRARRASSTGSVAPVRYWYPQLLVEGDVADECARPGRDRTRVAADIHARPAVVLGFVGRRGAGTQAPPRPTARAATTAHAPVGPGSPARAEHRRTSGEECASGSSVRGYKASLCRVCSR